MKPLIYAFKEKQRFDSDGLILTNEKLFNQYLETWITFLNTRTYTKEQKYIQTFVFCYIFCFFVSLKFLEIVNKKQNFATAD